MMSGEKIFLYGAGGHAKVVIDILEKQGLYDLIYLFDDDENALGKSIYGYEVKGERKMLLKMKEEAGLTKGFVAIGDNVSRLNISRWLKEQGFAIISTIHPSAQIAREVVIDCGTVIMAGAVINPNCIIGKNVIVNSGAIIEHDCEIADCVHVAPGANLCGTVKVGKLSFIGAGTTVTPNVKIGSGVKVAAGSTVTRDIPDNTRVKLR